MFLDSLKMVFLNPFYLLIAAVVATIFWIIFNFYGQLLFFSPYLAFYLPHDAYLWFILTNIMAILLGIVISMNIYLLKRSSLKISKSIFSGTIFGLASSTCASCSSFGFLTISAFGGFSTITTNFLTNYETPIRIISIVILIYALYTMHIKITKSCFLDIKKQIEN